MRRQRLLVNIIYDPQYKGYVIDVPQLPGCMSQGKTIDSALANGRKAIAAYLKTAGQGSIQEIPEVLTSQLEIVV